MAAKSQKTNKAEEGLLAGCRKDVQSITADWTPLQSLIEGVKLREVKHVPKENGHLTEIFRKDWALDTGEIDQVFQVSLLPGGLSAWHTHRVTTDRLFITGGLVKIVLYDARQGSSTFGLVNVFRLGTTRPGLVVIPPGVWHGVQNLGSDMGQVLNLVDKAYQYEDPDHWRLPWDTDKIPYRFSKGINS
ncbi:MAG TPA: dTDP-4-dehydrorhamnose 3,5-epimerase family protein [Verrucomicrobiae bacterium]